jgi:hypothetical protein
MLEHAIHCLRGQRVMLDVDLAQLYGVPTKAFNQAVKRNEARFPEDFRFQLTPEEADNLRSQTVTSSQHGGRRYLPWVFTQEGVAMLSGVLSSQRAIAVNIEIMRAFVRMRQAIAINAELASRLAAVEAHLEQHRIESGTALAEHEQHIQVIFEAIHRLMDEDGPEADPPRVGFLLP